MLINLAVLVLKDIRIGSGYLFCETNFVEYAVSINCLNDMLLDLVLFISFLLEYGFFDCKRYNRHEKYLSIYLLKGQKIGIFELSYHQDTSSKLRDLKFQPKIRLFW